MTDQNPLVSIIIPTYNRAHLIGETLDSVLAQTYQNWECIVVDDGSTDDTDEVMAEYMAKDSRFQYHHRPKDRLPGGNAARNYGFEVSKGEYVNWLDSDDQIAPSKIEKQISLLKENNSANVCFCRIVICKADKIISKNIHGFPKSHLFEKYATKKISIGTNQPIWKKSFLLKQSLYNELIRRGQDYDFFIRAFSREDLNYEVVEENLVIVKVNSEDRITNAFKKYEANYFDSYLTGFKNAYKIISERKEKKYFIDISNLLLKEMVIILNNRDFKTANKLIFFMKQNAFIYRNHFVKVKMIVYFLRITNLKGFSRLKKHFYIPIVS